MVSHNELNIIQQWIHLKKTTDQRKNPSNMLVLVTSVALLHLWGEAFRAASEGEGNYYNC